MSDNELIEDKSARILLNRRAEIRKTINKLEEEYEALGDMIMRDYNKKKKRRGEER